MKMKINFIVITVLGIFSYSLGDEVSSSNTPSLTKNDSFALILKETKFVTKEVKSLIEKTLPQLPNDQEYEIDRKRFEEYLQLYRQYRSALPEDCGEKALEFYESQNTFIHLYLMNNIKSPRAVEVVRLLNDNGMQNIQKLIDEKRKLHNFEAVQWKLFEQYILDGHC
ncbi:uncharacterized protein LOC142237789 [Haematobia irritans]|uniref:uncharacterized protein LOC142237789 n=1 Tax=Haematobia irritans TaxID=7368 RepID=UPI003F509F68